MKMKRKAAIALYLTKNRQWKSPKNQEIIHSIHHRSLQ